MAKYKHINAKDLDTDICRHGTILDVRTHAEHKDCRLAARHIHIPMDEITPNRLIHEHHLKKDDAIYILCLAGRRATMVADALSAHGFTNLFVIDGGLNACRACNQALRT